MEELRTEFTAHMHTLVSGMMARIRTFYCREDLRAKAQEVLYQYERKFSGYEFRLKELNEMCDACGLDADELCDSETMEAELEKIPTRQGLRRKLLKELHEIFLEFPTSADYMARLVHRLEPQCGKEPVRLTIAKKFVAETEYHTEPVIAHICAKLSASEKQVLKTLSGAEKRSFLASRLDDGIFDALSRNTAELSPAQLLQLLIKQQKLDPEGAFRFSPAILQSAANHLDAAAPEDTVSLLKALESAPDGALIGAMEQEFCAFLKPLGKDKNYKQAKKDQKKAVKTDWTLLKLADDLATGKFRVNGITREQLYVFAIAFGMRYYPDTKAADHDPILDIEKNLFRDYYHDNLLRYVLDDEYIQNKSYYDAEPTGEGINFKNYVEVIYLYCLTKDHLSPLEQLKMAQNLIDKCAKQAKKHTERVTAVPEERTQIFRGSFLDRMMEIETEDALIDYIYSHYYIYNSAYSGVRMMYGAQQNTARELYRELTSRFLEEYPDSFGTAGDRIELNNGIDLPALLEQTAQDDAELFAELRKDNQFMALLENLEKKLQTQKSHIFKLYRDAEAAAAHTYTRTELITLYYCYFLNVLQELVEDFGILDLPQLYREFCDGDGIRPGINDYLHQCRYQTISEKNPFDMFVVFAVFLELIRWDT